MASHARLHPVCYTLDVLDVVCGCLSSLCAAAAAAACKQLQHYLRDALNPQNPRSTAGVSSGPSKSFSDMASMGSRAASGSEGSASIMGSTASAVASMSLPPKVVATLAADFCLACACSASHTARSRADQTRSHTFPPATSDVSDDSEQTLMRICNFSIRKGPSCRATIPVAKDSITPGHPQEVSASMWDQCQCILDLVSGVKACRPRHVTPERAAAIAWGSGMTHIAAPLLLLCSRCLAFLSEAQGRSHHDCRQHSRDELNKALPTPM